MCRQLSISQSISRIVVSECRNALKAPSFEASPYAIPAVLLKSGQVLNDMRISTDFYD